MTQLDDELELTRYHEAGHAVADAYIGQRFSSIEIFFDKQYQRFDGETKSLPNQRFRIGIPGVAEYAIAPPPTLEDNLLQNFAGIVAQTMREQERAWGAYGGSWDIDGIVAEALSDKYKDTDDSDERNDLIEAWGREDDRDTLFRSAIIEAFNYLSQPHVWAVVRELAEAALNAYNKEAQEGKLKWDDLEPGLIERLEALETKSKSS